MESNSMLDRDIPLFFSFLFFFFFFRSRKRSHSQVYLPSSIYTGETVF